MFLSCELRLNTFYIQVEIFQHHSGLKDKWNALSVQKWPRPLGSWEWDRAVDWICWLWIWILNIKNPEKGHFYLSFTIQLRSKQGIFELYFHTVC